MKAIDKRTHSMRPENLSSIWDVGAIQLKYHITFFNSRLNYIIVRNWNWKCTFLGSNINVDDPKRWRAFAGYLVEYFRGQQGCILSVDGLQYFLYCLVLALDLQ